MTMEEELKCPVCQELLIEATALNCAHSFCSYCLQEWKKTREICPVCRERIVSESRSLAVDSYIDRMVVHLSHEMRQRREDNQAFREEQKQQQQQDQPPPGVVEEDDDDEDEDDDDDDDDRLWIVFRRI